MGVSMADAIFQDLKDRILRLDVRPGQRLLEEDVARYYQASRTPVREVLKRLAEAGLVQSSPRRGVYVRALRLREVEEHYEIRVALETFTVEVVTRRRAGYPWADLWSVWVTMPRPLPTAERVLRLDEEFHTQLAAVGGNAALLALLRRINDQIRAVRSRDFTFPERIRTTYAQHREILRRMRRGEGKRAAEAMRQHILESKAHVFAAMKELMASVHFPERS